MTGLGLNAQAAKRALDDAGLKVSDIDGVLTAYSFTEPYFMLASVICEYLGLKPRFNASLVVGGASPAVMLKHAAEAIVAGQAETILICAGENRATGISRDAAVAALLAVGHPYFEQPYGGSIPGYYAMIAQRHMHEYGTTREHLAAVAVSTRAHALLHPNAHMKTPLPTPPPAPAASPRARPWAAPSAIASSSPAKLSPAASSRPAAARGCRANGPPSPSSRPSPQRKTAPAFPPGPSVSPVASKGFRLTR